MQIDKSELGEPHTVIGASGQLETDGSNSDVNLREAPHANINGEQAFTAPGSIVDIVV